MGLLDFPTLYDGRAVYLCWRLGDQELSTGTTWRKDSAAGSRWMTPSWLSTLARKINHEETVSFP